MADIELRLGAEVLVMEGTAAVALSHMGMGDYPPFLNVFEPEIIAEIHKTNRVSGASIARTNTYGATPAELASSGYEGNLDEATIELNTLGVKFAREAGFPHVLGEMALNAYSDDTQGFTLQATTLIRAGVDGLLLSGAHNLNAVRNIVELCRTTNTPVLVSLLNEFDNISVASQQLLDVGVAAVGYETWNCEDPFSAVEALVDAGVRCPIITPATEGDSPDEFAQMVTSLVALGARVISVGLGGTPSHIAAAFASVGGVIDPAWED